MKRLRIMAAALSVFAAASFMPVPSAAQTEMPAPRVALVYTVTTPELKADVERALRESVGRDVELMVYEVSDAFNEIRAEDYLTPHAAALIAGTYMRAVEDGADAVLSICSTVEDVAYAMQDAARLVGVPVVMVNDAMCREAVRRGHTIAVAATFPCSIAPTRRTLERAAREAGRRIEVREVVIDGGFGMEEGEFKRLLAERISAEASDADVVIFTQGSMAYVAESVSRALGVPVLANPVFSAQAVAEALAAKGVVAERYLPYVAEPDWRRMARSGLYIQSNADFFCGFSTRRKALRLLSEGRIHVLGTDCHNMERRAPRMDEAVRVIARALGDDTVQRLEEQARRLLKRGGAA